MKIKVIGIGKSAPAFIAEGVQHYSQKIKHFCEYEWLELVTKKKSEQAEQSKKIDAEIILTHLESSDFIILLDERGKAFESSYDFSEFINKKQISGRKRIVFIIGGSFGFDQMVYDRADEKISLASLTYTHQMIRLIFLEQLYRGYAILNHLPYHHE
jgi:23S rRNA (pseudouridine1915-N3)-methyltransferase